MGLLNLRNALMAGKRKPTAKDYVQSGLVAMWDGIENSGWGTHNPNATVWKDLIDANDFALHDVVAADNKMTFSSSSSYAETQNQSSSAVVVEIVMSGNFAQAESCIISMQTPASGRVGRFVFWYQDKIGFTLKTVGAANSALAQSKPFTAKTFTLDGLTPSAFINGASVTTQSASDYFTRQRGNGITISPSRNWCFLGDIHSIRLYSRALTADEIAANYAIDKARFNLP